MSMFIMFTLALLGWAVLANDIKKTAEITKQLEAIQAGPDDGIEDANYVMIID